jgi:septal ring factor EnvC (AmiA/AmiB activator)
MNNDTFLHDIALLRALVADKDKRLNALEEEVCHLRQSLGDSESTVHALRQSLSESESTIQSLVEKLNLARRKRFGASSETKEVRHLNLVAVVLNCPKTCRVNTSWLMFQTQTRSVHAASQRYARWVKAPVKNWRTSRPNCMSK